MNDYIKITIVKISELDIDGSSKPDLSFFLYCTSWGEDPQQTQIIKNNLSPNFNTTFQIPINDFKTDIITFKLYDLSKNRALSSISIHVSRIPPGDGYKILNLNPEPYVKNGGKLEIEFQGKDEEYSDSTESPIPPLLPSSEDSDPSFENLEKIMQANKLESSLISIQKESDKKIQNEYSDYSYYDSNSTAQKKIIKDTKEQKKNDEYSYYSSDSPNNSHLDKQLKEKSSDYEYRSAIKMSRQSSNIKTSEKSFTVNHAENIINKNNNEEYSYYSSDPPKRQLLSKNTKEKSNDYEYYSTDPTESPKSQKNDLSPKTPIKMNCNSIDQLCDSYNYESSTDSPVIPSKPAKNSSSAKLSDGDSKESHSNLNFSQKLNIETSNNQTKSSLSNDLTLKNKDSEQKIKSTNFSQKENQNPNKESKKVKSVAVIKRRKTASTRTATKKNDKEGGCCNII